MTDKGDNWIQEVYRLKDEGKSWPPQNPELRDARLAEFDNDPALRKWAIWKQYRAGGTTFEKVGKDFGISGGRVRQVVLRCDRLLRTALQRAILTIPVLQEVRDATLGIEFVFRNELALEDKTGWNQLEPTAVGSAYDPMIPEWKEEWGRQDTSPPKPIPAYTYYKVVIPKEQSDGE